MRRFIVTPQDPLLLKVQLRNPPRRISNIMTIPQPLEERTELSVMLRYSNVNGGHQYPVHRWPPSVAGEMNRFKHPHVMSESELYEYTGLSPLNFW